MSSFIWPCAVLLGSSEQRPAPESTHCSPPARCVQGALMTNPPVAWLARAHTHTHIYKHVHAKLLYDTRLEACVTHANETGPASSRQHNVILHSSASLQKPKSFSPPSPVIVTLMEGRSGNHLSPTQSGGLTNLSPYVSLSHSWKKKKKKHLPYTISNIVSGNWHMQWTKTHLQGHRVPFNPEETSDLSESSRGCKGQGCNSDISSVSFRSMSQL